MKPTLFLSELLSDEDLRRVCRETGCGLEIIQFGVSDNLDHFPETLQKEKELLHQLGDPPAALHGPFLDLNPMSYDSRIRQVVLDRFAQAYEAAEELHARRIVFHSGMVPTVYYLEGWAERMIDFWEEFLPGRESIPVCMENVLDREFEPFRQITDALCGRYPSFGICLDAGHAHCYSRHPEEAWAEALKTRILHLHLHDNDGSADRHLALGEGTVHWEAVMHTLLDQGHDLTVTAECSTAEAALRSLHALERLFIKK